MTRVVLVSGKGGVGKTTVAAATAVRASELGHRTLLVSVDRAHNLGDVLGQRLTAEPADVPGCSGLSALEADPHVELRRHWDSFTGYFSRFLQWAGLGGAQADETVVFPGLEELLLLTRLNELVEAATWDLIVVDLAPTASSLRLLSFPDLMSGPFGRLARLERSFFKVTRGALERVSSVPIPEDAMYDALEGLAARLSRLRELLVDPARCSVRLVSLAERIVIEETRSAFGLLSLFGLCVDAVVLNRLLPASASEGFFGAWAQVQARERSRAQDLFADVPLLELAWQPGEVIGPSALSRASLELYGERDPAKPFVERSAVRFSQTEAGTTLELVIRQPDSRALDLKQRGDELIVTASGWRRQIALPTSLRGRSVRSARLRDGVLQVTFAPAGRKEAS
jgi:arsenite/tail-anchored protein-transporting ATPase